jgi:hypothetical protein
MKTLISVAVFLLVAPSFVAAQDLFVTGVLGTEWGSTLQQVKAKYPNGFAWHGVGRKRESIVYQVTGQFSIPKISAQVKVVEFQFSMQNQLRSIVLHFDSADADIALYDIASLLGQEYGTKDEAIARIFYWKSNRVSTTAFSLGLGEQHPWAYLQVNTHGGQDSNVR